MKKWIGLLVGSLLMIGCNASRVISPLNEGEWRVGGHYGGPEVSSITLPLTSLYVAHGKTSTTSEYLAIHTTALAFQALQLEWGQLTQLKPSTEAWSPELNATYGIQTFTSLRDGAFRAYPFVGMQVPWMTYQIKPYLGSEIWIDPTYVWSDYGQGSLIHPSLHAGLRYINRFLEVGIETKWINPTRDFQIPQATVQGFGNIGAKGTYVTVAIRL
ncbi:MAG: hypothetical protein HOE88_04560 [Flavobacteriales bacterium]|jgi:hypothetical protein|nr:hypothetical protein [Flavobacteriales bacterium]MDE0791773.1 hypothetical protein [Schleiferiaceae bacterium]MBT3677485.1 hypothetical protein [Flavobacteriales bacterium]MBT3739282.1 hypothetical protein [Flavobacteriales bacterium]MBT4102631.1 hypothetical protein [Flavobacteriales bacterium]|tara:strand:+ start:375 stop:1019 length:645 start_codon:yes stop_codon:yes gene_type:complete